MTGVHEATLDPELVRQLLADIGAAAEVQFAQVRSASGSRRLSFAEATARFEDGAVTALQVQYVHQGVEWRDTLTHGLGGVRLVRFRVPSC